MHAQEDTDFLIGTQQGIWFAQQVMPKPEEFNVGHYIEIVGDIDLDCFSTAVNVGIAEADSLHCQYAEVDGEIQQRFMKPQREIDALEVMDFSQAASAYESAISWMKSDISNIIDLEELRPRYRHCLIHVGESGKPKWLWYQRYHHIDVDGFSFNGITQRIVSEYNHLKLGYAKPEAFTSFKEVIQEHQHFKHSDQYVKAQAFWKEQTKHLSETISLVTGGRNTRASGVTKTTIKLAGGDWLACGGNKILPSEFVMALVFAYLHMSTGKQQLCVGFPFMRRMGSVAIGSTGSVVNVLPLVLDIRPNMTLVELTQSMNKAVRQARRHQMYDAEQIQRDQGKVGQSLYGPILNFKPFEDEINLAGISGKTHILSAGPIDDIEFSPALNNNVLSLTLTGNAAKYSTMSLDLHARRFAYMVEQIAENPNVTLNELLIIPLTEHRMIEQWSQGETQSKEQEISTVLDVFSLQVQAKPHTTALVFGEQCWTFEKLNAEIECRARQIASQGAGKGDIIGVALPRGAETIITLLAILRSGATYLPIDLDYPQERIETIIAQAKPWAVIVENEELTSWKALTSCMSLPELEAIPLKDTPPIEAISTTILDSDVAYIVFTSGSTGKPKGVMNTHGSLLNLLHSHNASVFSKTISHMAKRKACKDTEVQVRAAHTTSFSFDASWEQILWMLCGHSLYLYDDEQRKDAYELTVCVKQDHIDALDLPPSLLGQMLDNDLMNQAHVPSLVLIGSEAVPESLWARVNALPDLLVENFYGPTEFTVDAVSASLNSDETPVIGRPIRNASAYVLDDDLSLVAIGQVGELYLAGAGLAKGYLNQAGMTADRFIANPFDNGQVMYRTGDLVKWRDNGQLDFIGRSDNQVKIRGFRIELGDVESAINAIDGIETTVVIAERHGESHRLLAYCTLRSQAVGHLNEQTLFNHITKVMPDYMVPATVTIMDAFSLNVNGKIDRASLPKPILISRDEWVAPTTAEEHIICGAVSELLSVDHVGISDDFFNLGGDSISAMGLGTRLRKSGYELRPRDIFAERQLGAMAKIMKPLQTLVDTVQDGEIQPLPMWQWFKEHFSEETSYVQGVFVKIESDIRLNHIQAALTLFVAQQSACRLAKKDGKYVIEPMDKLNINAWVDSTSVDDIERSDLDGVFEQASQSLSLSAGKLLQLIMVSDAQGERGLMFLAHHLIIDGVSWRILLPQLKALTRAQVEGKKPEVDTEVTGINTWSKSLYTYMNQAREQIEWWRECESRVVEALKAPAHIGTITHRRVMVPSCLTQAILSHGYESTAIDIDEILLAAVTSALGALFHRKSIKVNVESHGREEFDSALNLSQTMGWFTTEYPVIIDLPTSNTNALLRHVKQAKRRVKDNGLGYMALRYLDNPNQPELASLSQRNPTSLLFNYLGRFEQAKEYWAPVSREGLFSDAFAVLLDSENALQHQLELNVFVDESGEQPQLALNWSWNDNQFSEQEITQVCDLVEQALQTVVKWLSTTNNTSAALQVPAEYTEEGITLNDAQALEDRYDAIRDVLPALPLQEGLLFQLQVGDEQSNYNSTTRLTFQGEVSQQRVQEALDAVIDRHPQLNAQFDSAIMGRTVQIIPKHRSSWPLECIEITTLSREKQTSYLAQREKCELERQFDLNNPQQPLLGATLIHHDPNQSTLFISAHHLVVDGWSTPILLNDFFQAYLGNSAETVNLSTDYAQVVSQLKRRDKAEAKDAWRGALQGVTPTIAFDDIPMEDHVKEHKLVISSEKTQQLNQLLRRSGLTINALMQGVWSSILASMTGREEVVFGTPISGRFGQVKGVNEHIGLFSNTIPVRMALQSEHSLLEQLKTHQETQIQLLEYDELGLGEIQQLVGGETLFDTLLVVENYPDNSNWYDTDYHGVALTDIHNRGYTHYPLTMLVLPGDQLHILCEYRDTAGIAQQIMQRFEKILDTIIQLPDAPLAQLDLRLNEEILLQQRVNQTEVAMCNKTLRSLMIEQAERTPNNIALIDSQRRFTYQAMRAQVTALANLLIDHHVEVGDIVAVALPRGVTLSLVFNSIIECGSAYLPLDVSYPDERLAYMVADAKPKLLITTSEFADRFCEFGDVIVLDELPEPTTVSKAPALELLTSAHGAYIIYTSGSTGNPKGVLVSHKAIVNRLQWMQFEYQLNQDDVVLQKTPCSFDVSVWEFFWPLIQGATLVMAPAESHKDPEWLLQIIDDYKVTTMHFVPSMLAAFMASIESRTATGISVASSLKRVFCSGEALSKDLSTEYGKWINAPLHNLYGPTEAAVDVTYCPAFGEPMEESVGNSVPIGLPVWNTQVYVLDSFLRETPVGVPGELYLAGEQLAIGYLNRSSLTADRFIANPFSHGERMYRTGDVVRWLSSGRIEYLGRSDDQLKIRGQRIELGEIETALQSLPSVKQALVCAKSLGVEKKLAGADDRQLVGYVILHDECSVGGEQLKQELSEHLPAHMVPIAIIALEDFPLSANGKLDRKALPLPSDVAMDKGRKAYPGLEAQLVAIFSEVLGIKTVSAEDDFFALGGHSLMAMKLTADIRRVLNLPVSVGQIMVNPTVEKLAQLLMDDDALNDPTLAGFGEVLPIRAGDGPALFCINSGSGFAWQYTGLPKYLHGNYPIIGLQSPHSTGAITVAEDIDEASDIYIKALKKIQPEGPYHLMGYSFGGNVAQQIAATLEQEGETVAFLGLLDTYPPEGQDWNGPINEDEQDEIEREKEQFLAASEVTDDEMDQQRLEMYNTITANYEGAVRLLAKANTPRYNGVVDLFIAKKTVPKGYDIDNHWHPFVDHLEKHYFDCSHEDIIAPDNVGDIGEQLNRLLSDKATLA